MRNKSSLTVFFLMLFLIFIYLRPYEFIPFLPLQIARYSIIVALIFSFFENYKRNFVWKETSFKIFFLIQLLVLALLPFSLWKANSFSFWLEAYSKIFIVFYLLLVVIDNYKRLDLIFSTIFICCNIVAFRVLVAYFNNNVVFDAHGTQRVIGVSTLASSNVNDLALVLAMAVPLGFYIIYTSKNIFKKMIFFILTLVNILALMYTGSRGGYIGVLIGVFIFFVMLYWRQKVKLLFLFAILATSLIVFTPQQYKARFMTSFDTQDYSYADEKYGRIAIWKRGIQSMLIKPQGVGIKNFSLAEGARKREEGIYGRWNVAHNSYIEIGVELGIIGLILYILFLFSGVFSIRKIISAARNIKDNKSLICAYALTGSLIAFMIASFFLSQAYLWNQYLFVALITALKNIMVNNQNNIAGIARCIVKR